MGNPNKPKSLDASVILGSEKDVQHLIEDYKGDLEVFEYDFLKKLLSTSSDDQVRYSLYLTIKSALANQSQSATITDSGVDQALQNVLAVPEKPNRYDYQPETVGSIKKEIANNSYRYRNMMIIATNINEFLAGFELTLNDAIVATSFDSVTLNYLPKKHAMRVTFITNQEEQISPDFYFRLHFSKDKSDKKLIKLGYVLGEDTKDYYVGKLTDDEKLTDSMHDIILSAEVISKTSLLVPNDDGENPFSSSRGKLRFNAKGARLVELFVSDDQKFSLPEDWSFARFEKYLWGCREHNRGLNKHSGHLV